MILGSDKCTVPLLFGHFSVIIEAKYCLLVSSYTQNIYQVVYSQNNSIFNANLILGHIVESIVTHVYNLQWIFYVLILKKIKTIMILNFSIVI